MNTLLKTKKAMLAGLLLSSLAIQAQAATVDLSGSAATTGLITKDYSFSIANGYVGSLSGFFTSGTDFFYGDNYGFSIAGVSLSGGALVQNTGFVADIVDPMGWVALTYTNNFSATNLAAGNYTLKLTGTSYSAGSSFSGSYVLNTTAVPEPESYALMLMGLGLLGLIARRKA